VGMGGLCLGAYGLLDGSHAGSLGFPALLGGGLLCAAGLVVGSRRVHRTQYRPDPWRLPEWVVVLAGALPAAVLVAGAGATAVGLNPSTQPLVWPTLPAIPALAILAAALPALVAPPPLRPAKLKPMRPGGSTSAPGTATDRSRRPGVTSPVEVPA
jgi:energy-coupling factor transport system permease protein